MKQPPISDYALLGDCETAALVDKSGSIDWLCWPRFDSESCFTRLLGTEEHGYWRVGPKGKWRSSRSYRPGTLILDTRFEAEEGVVTITDFMPVRDADNQRSSLIRIVHCESGKVDMELMLVLRFGYGSIVPWVTKERGRAFRAMAGPHSVTLCAPLDIQISSERIESNFTLSAGDTIPFVLTYEASHLPLPPPIDAHDALKATEKIWRDWTRRSTYDGPWQDAVERSLITIKALTYHPTGGVLAAPTTSLPEKLGGERNWDYRLCWLRDSTFTLLSLLNAGFRDEAEAWCDWLLRAVAGAADQLQPLYGIGGELCIGERELTWLPGYCNSRPVRVGNAATEQLQLDVFGNVLDTLHEAHCAGLQIHEAAAGLETHLVNHLEALWQEPDEGIWEMRNNRQHFVHSKLMCWVAFDRAIKDVEQHGLRGPVDRWRKHRDQLREEILSRGFNEEIGAFTQAYGSTHLDASVLLIPIMGFLPADDPRMVSTVEVLSNQLMRDGLMLRYDTERVDDGLPPGEGAFIACTLWLADNLIMQGRRDEALTLFERVMALRNDVGLLAEQYDSDKGMQVGNFPQAFSHFALIDTAFNFHGEKGAAAHHAQTEGVGGNGEGVTEDQ